MDIFDCKKESLIICYFVFSYENKCSPENSEKPSLAFQFISVKINNLQKIQYNINEY